MYSQKMMMRDGYLDGHDGAWLIHEDIYKALFKIFWDAGYQIHVHQNGDLGLDRVLDVLEENLKNKPREDHRTTVVHFGYSAKDQIQRLKKLNVLVSANPYYVTTLSDLYSKEGQLSSLPHTPEFPRRRSSGFFLRIYNSVELESEVANGHFIGIQIRQTAGFTRLQ